MFYKGQLGFPLVLPNIPKIVLNRPPLSHCFFFWSCIDLISLKKRKLLTPTVAVITSNVLQLNFFPVVHGTRKKFPPPNIQISEGNVLKRYRLRLRFCINQAKQIMLGCFTRIPGNNPAYPLARGSVRATRNLPRPFLSALVGVKLKSLNS